jgi:hypothetical protein
MNCKDCVCLSVCTEPNGSFDCIEALKLIEKKITVTQRINTENCLKCNGDMTVVADNHLGMVGCPDCGGTGKLSTKIDAQNENTSTFCPTDQSCPHFTEGECRHFGDCHKQ